MRRIRRFQRGVWRKVAAFLKLRVLHVDDSPYRIAMGVAVGLFIGWTPTVGIHMLLAIAVCFLLRANKFVAVAAVWANNPFTMLPIFYSNYLVGRTIVSFRTGAKSLNAAELKEIFERFNSLGNALIHFSSGQFWQDLMAVLWKIGIELWIGSVIIGILVAVAGYVVTYYLVLFYRLKRARRAERPR